MKVYSCYTQQISIETLHKHTIISCPFVFSTCSKRIVRLRMFAVR